MTNYHGPQNYKEVAKISRIHPEYKWKICLVCGDLCPQGVGTLFEDCDSVHITCKRGEEYVKLFKKLTRLRESKLKSSLF